MTTASQSSKRGVALVLVLGILSVMTLLAVSFAISMRVERLAASSFEDGAKAKHLLDVALSEALLEIDYGRGGDVYPSWTNLASQGGEPYIRILQGPATNYLPEALVDDAANEALNVEWVGISELRAGSGDTTSGQVAFLVVDCSGLIDYNFAGGITNRVDGSEVGEVVVAQATHPALDVTDLDAFITGRSTTWKRFESVPELSTLGSFLTDNQYGVTYSYFPTGYLFNAQVREQIDISAALPPQGILQAEFSGAGLTPGQSAQLQRSLRDYYDADNVPSDGLSLPCTEAVPMINEIVVTNTLETAIESGPTNRYDYLLTVAVELWYPFGTQNPEAYELEIRGGVGGGTSGFSPPILPVTVLGSLSPWNPDSYQILSFTFPIASLVQVAPPTLPTDFLFRATLREESSRIPVDQVTLNLSLDGAPGLPAIPAVGETVVGQTSWQVDDPRFNWDDGLHWTNTSSVTMGSINDSVMTAMDPGKDGTTNMYVRNAPMETIGEFGYLLYDTTKPWTTCRMLGPDPDGTMNVLDRFIVNTNQRGYVNINSPFPDVVAATLVSAPIGHYPGDVSGGLISPSAADCVAGEIVALGSITNLSGLVGITEASLACLPASITDNASYLESIFRNSIGLWKTRQNLYTIFLAAQTLKGSTVVAEKKAVVVVWQDPFPNAQPTVEHSAFVRFFHELEELE